MALCKLKNWILKISRKTLKKMRIQKNFREKNSNRGEFEPPRYHYIGSKTKTAFLTNFTKFSWNLGWKIENDLYWLRLVADTVPVLARADLFADMSRIGGILHKCRMYRCACLVSWSFTMLRLWNPVALLRVSFLLIRPGVAAEFQSAQIKGNRKRIFAPVNAYNAHRATQNMQDI